jgi:hypothetical protein
MYPYSRLIISNLCILNNTIIKIELLARRARKSRAKNSGGAAGGGAAPEHSEAEGRANTLKFDIFCKRSASKKKKAANG